MVVWEWLFGDGQLVMSEFGVPVTEYSNEITGAYHPRDGWRILADRVKDRADGK
jgi:hypothetical protein